MCEEVRVPVLCQVKLGIGLLFMCVINSPPSFFNNLGSFTTKIVTPSTASTKLTKNKRDRDLAEGSGLASKDFGTT